MDSQATIAKARELFMRAQDAALAASPLGQMPSWVSAGEPPNAEALRSCGLDGVERGDKALFLVRNAFHRRWGFSIPCAEAAEALRRLSPILEVGAGSGYWSALLSARGCDVVATDPNAAGDVGYGFEAGRHHPVQPLSAGDAIKRYPDRAVFCSWPTRDDPWALDMISSLPSGQRLALIVEPRGGKTASDDLHDHLDGHWRISERIAIPQFPGFRDELLIYRRQ